MRIVGGIWRGRALLAPSGRATRPTTDRTRESMASMLLSARGLELAGASVLDAFAGSGAIGLELLSRGARGCTFVDADRRAASCVRRNVSALGAGERATVICGNAFGLTARDALAGAPFDVVILDPPYATAATDVTKLLVNLTESGNLSPSALVLYERDAAARGLELSQVPGADLLRSRKHGTTACDLMTIGG